MQPETQNSQAVPNPDQPPQHTPTQSQPPEITQATHRFGKSERFKRSFFQILIGCLVGSASIAVIAVLAGSFNDTLARALGTIAMVALHAILSFSYLTETDKRDKKDGGRSIELFGNFVFLLIITSFMTSIFAIWQLIGGDITWRLYMLYGVLLFATLHADVLYRIRKFDKNIDVVIAANYVLMALVVTMLTILIFSPEPSDLSDIFYRILAAAAIIDATLTITAIIMHKLYLQKHPEMVGSLEKSSGEHSKNFWKNPLVILLLIFLAFQIVGGIVAVFLEALGG